MVAPSLVMITSPSACLTILSMPLGPRDVLTASESALAASMFEILTSTFLESSLFRVWQRWQVWWKGVGAARSESSVKKKKRRRGGQTPGSDSQIPRRSRPDRRVSQRSPLRPRRPPPPFLGAFDTSVPKTRRTHRKVSPFLPPPAFGATMVSACSRLLEWPLRLCEGLGEAGCTDIPARARSWKKYPWREDFV